MKRTFCAVLSVIIAGAFLPSLGNAAVYSAVDDFTLTPQPLNGVWTYLSNGSMLSSTASSPHGSGMLTTWHNGIPYNSSNPVSAGLTRNTGPVTALPPFFTVVIPNSHLNLDPQGTNDVTVRFTVPVADIYQVSGDFRGNDLVSVPPHAVSVRINNNSAFTDTITQFGTGDNAVFYVVQSLMAGDTIDFVVNRGASPNHLGTGLSVTIQSGADVPEPRAFALLLLGLLSTVFLRNLGSSNSRKRLQPA
jgi:hypothetical protein